MLSEDEKNQIKITYFKMINNTIPRFRNYELYNGVIVSIIHNNQDLNFNCFHREVLYALKELLGKNWIFKENNFGTALYCNFKYVDPKPIFKDIFPIYKKFYMERMKSIFEQYDERIINPNKEDQKKNPIFYDIHSEYYLEYNQLKNDVLNLKNQISEKFLKLLIYKISYINDDISQLIYNFSKENYDSYFKLRKKIEDLRHNIKMRINYYKP
jgi:hypothetical protein